MGSSQAVHLLLGRAVWSRHSDGDSVSASTTVCMYMYIRCIYKGGKMFYIIVSLGLGVFSCLRITIK